MIQRVKLNMAEEDALMRAIRVADEAASRRDKMLSSVAASRDIHGPGLNFTDIKGGELVIECPDSEVSEEEADSMAPALTD